jgi:heat shock protein HslJ
VKSVPLGIAWAAAALVIGCAAEAPTPTLALDELPGTGWRLVTLEDHNGTLDALDVAEITLAFTAQKGLVGSGGCNRYFGGIEVSDEGVLSIGPLGSTQMACGDVPMGREYRYLRALEACEAIEGAAGRLEFKSRDGAVRIVFEEAPEAAVIGP